MSSVYNISYSDGGSSPFTGTIEVPNGGTGTTSLTGVLIGNGTSPITTKTNPAGAFVGDSDAQTLTNKSLVDATTEIVDGIDATKKITFQCAVSSPGTTLELQTNQTTSQSLSIPDVSAGDVIMTTGTGQTITGAKLHTGGLTVNDNNFFIRDQLGTTKRMTFSLQTGSNNCTLTIAGRQTSSRQIFIPNLTIDDDYFVTQNTSQAMVNKTLTSPIIDGTTNMPTLTASQAVVTDASKNLVSLPYTELSTASSIPYRDADGETYFNSVNLLQRSIASATSTTTLNVHDPQIIAVIGSQPHTIRLPAATSYAQIGRIFIISNRSTKDIRLESGTGSTIRSAVSSACSISVVCNSVAFDGAAAWIVFNDTQYAGRLQTSNGTAVETQNAAAPSPGQVLTALTSTTASWQTPSDPGYIVDNVQTTNETPTTFGGVALSTSSVVNIKAYVVARNPTASTTLGYELFAVANNNAGVVTIIGGVSVNNSKETNVGADATLVVSGTSVAIQVTGLAGQTIDWRCKIYTVAV